MFGICLCMFTSCQKDKNDQQGTNQIPTPNSQYIRQLTPEESKQIDLDEKLFEAVAEGDLEKIKQFSKEGANVNALHSLPPPLYKSIFPLWSAARKNRTKMIFLLIELGADVNLRDSDGETALSIAVIFGNYESAKILIDHGANVNAINDYNSCVLLGAVNNNRVEMTKLLLGHGADTSIKNFEGKTPLMYAKEKGYTEIIKLLEAAGAKE